MKTKFLAALRVAKERFFNSLKTSLPLFLAFCAIVGVMAILGAVVHFLSTARIAYALLAFCFLLPYGTLFHMFSSFLDDKIKFDL